MTEQNDPVDPEEYLRRLQEGAAQSSAEQPPTSPYQSGQYQSGHDQSGQYQSGQYQSGQYEPGHYQPGHYQSASMPPAAYPASGQRIEHSSATTSMVLGIIGLASIGVLCGLGLVVSPVAWVLGSRAVSEIDANPGRFTGRDRANAGRIMGIIGTILLVLGLVALALFVVAMIAAPSEFTPSDPYDTSTPAPFDDEF